MNSIVKSACVVISFLLLLITPSAQSQTIFLTDSASYITMDQEKGIFALATPSAQAPVIVSSTDYLGVHHAAKQIAADIHAVAGHRPVFLVDSVPLTKEVVLIGTIGKNQFIDSLIRMKKFDAGDLTGRWETFIIQVIENPFSGVDKALVIAGSDKRGTIFGAYDLSEKIGVSPWYWWADVPPMRTESIFILPGRFTMGEPKIKYRGIFINDEAPALSGWVAEKFGGFNSKFYAHVFELILRLKGNFLWPAMWGRAFYDDDPENPKLADEYGVVIGTSHHEPMMRAHDEWRRYGKGNAWNYEKSDSALKEFWREGIKRMDSYESIITLAMRGDGDEPMTEDANISLLQRIVTDQRQILKEVTGKDPASIPQVWALYKEVQEYYDKGMRVPDDVTLLLSDDNWGNLRKLPRPGDAPRLGGYGIYYHFDYVGGPRNYKWLNTNQIERVWEQMHLAYEYGARKIWIVNVGDIKPMEYPISFFLSYAWNPDAIGAADLQGFTRRWARKQFGSEYATEIAEILRMYTKYNSRRKPELLDSMTYSLVNYREAESVVTEYNALVERAQKIFEQLPAEYKDAYFQLVLHPVTASANLNELQVTAGRNHLYKKQERVATNDLARKVLELFKKDSTISYTYNRVIANGKWNHMMDQTHIGYTYWQQPDFNVMPRVYATTPPSIAKMGVAIEGSEQCWPRTTEKPVLPVFDSFHRQKYYIEIFNRGLKQFPFKISTGKKWVRTSLSHGIIDQEKRIWIDIDWEKAPRGISIVPITITGTEMKPVVVEAIVQNRASRAEKFSCGFVESNGIVSIEAHHYTNKIVSETIDWLTIENLGRTGSSVTPIPVTADEQPAANGSPHLEYAVHLTTSGEVNVKAFCSPTLNFQNRKIRYAVSFDDDPAVIVPLYGSITIQDWKYPKEWMDAVSDNIRITESKHLIKAPGDHILKFWMVDPGIVLQKIVIEAGNVKPSYLGPPESHFSGSEEAGEK